VASSELRRKDLFLLVARHAFADGHLDSSEKSLLKRLQKLLRIPPEEAKSLLTTARGEVDVGYVAPLDPKQLFLQACQAAAENGVLSDRERQLLSALANLLEISPEPMVSPLLGPAAPSSTPAVLAQETPSAPPPETAKSKKGAGDSEAAEERALAFEQAGNWQHRGAIWGGPLKDFQALWEHGWDYEWAAPLGRIVGAVGLVFLTPLTFTTMVGDPTVGMFLGVLAAICAWLTFHKSDIRPKSAREHVLSELVGHASRILRLPPPKRPEIWRDCEANTETLDNSYLIRLGIGTRFGMRWQHDPETDSYARSRYFCVFHLPVVVLGRYRIIDENSGSFYTLAKLPIHPANWVVVVVPWALLLLMVLI
jgi:hypothetical protein